MSPVDTETSGKVINLRDAMNRLAHKGKTRAPVAEPAAPVITPEQAAFFEIIEFIATDRSPNEYISGESSVSDIAGYIRAELLSKRTLTKDETDKIADALIVRATGQINYAAAYSAKSYENLPNVILNATLAARLLDRENMFSRAVTSALNKKIMEIAESKVWPHSAAHVIYTLATLAGPEKEYGGDRARIVTGMMRQFANFIPACNDMDEAAGIGLYLKNVFQHAIDLEPTDEDWRMVEKALSERAERMIDKSEISQFGSTAKAVESAYARLGVEFTRDMRANLGRHMLAKGLADIYNCNNEGGNSAREIMAGALKQALIDSGVPEVSVKNISIQSAVFRGDVRQTGEAHISGLTRPFPA